MLWQRLQTPPPDGGLWNSRKVAEWMSEFLERPVSKQRGWEYLQFIPAYSPELQPAERLWPIIDEPLANRSFTDLEELEKILFIKNSAYCCQYL